MTLKHLLPLLLFSFLSASVYGQYEPGLNRGLSINRPEGRRFYDIYVPTNISGTPALLFSFHAALSNKNDQRAFTNWEVQAERDGTFLPVWPNAVDAVWTTPTGGSGADDRGFIRALIEEIRSNIAFDEKRIYLTGYSNGGTFAQFFGYKEENITAAVSSMAGDFSSVFRDDALQEREEGTFKPVPVYLFHGYNDQIACWNNWHCFLWAFRHREASRFDAPNWARVNNCTGDAVTIAQNRGHIFGFGHHIHNGHRDFLWIRAYETCEGGVEVRQLLNSRDHSNEFWSGNAMANQRDYNDRILEFLFRFTLP